MSFQGDVAGIGLGELLQGLARGGRDGVLTLRGGKGLGATLGLSGGQIYLLPEPDEDPELWRKRCERAWVKDPNHRIDTLRMSEIAYAARLETMFQLLDGEGLHFRFEPGAVPMPGDAQAAEADEVALGRVETGTKIEVKVPVYCHGISVELLLLEYARLTDECGTHGDANRLPVHFVPRLLVPEVPSAELERFWSECDGMSNVGEIADRLGWPLRQCKATLVDLTVKGYLRFSDARELLVLAQTEIGQNFFARGASRLHGWCLAAPPGPPTLEDAEMLLAEWERGKLPVVLASMEAPGARTLLRRLDLAGGQASAAVTRWKEMRRHHVHDSIAELALVHWQLRSEEEADAPHVNDLLRLARDFQDRGQNTRSGVILHAAAQRMPESTSARLEVGTRLIAVGRAEEGIHWVLEACRTMIEAGYHEKTLAPLRAVLTADKTCREARRLFSLARNRSTSGKRTRRVSVVGLSTALVVSLAAFVKVRADRDFDRRLGEVLELSEDPEHALQVLEHNFGGDPSQQVAELRATFTAQLRASREALRNEWMARFMEAQQECTTGDEKRGLQLALDLKEPPYIPGAEDTWPTLGELLDGLGARLEQTLLQFPKIDQSGTPESEEDLRRERRFGDLLEELRTIAQGRERTFTLDEFDKRLAQVTDQLADRDERRTEARRKREEAELTTWQDSVLATARVAHETGDVERAADLYRQLVESDAEGVLTRVLEDEVGCVSQDVAALQEARELARDGRHARGVEVLRERSCNARLHMLPIRVESQPEGARARFSDGSIRTTPFTMEIGLEEHAQITFDLPGHERERVTLDGPQDLSVLLSRLPQVSWNGGGRVKALPVPVEGGYVVSDRSGTIARVDADGEQVWKRQLGTLGGVARTPVFLPQRQGTLLAVTEDGSAWLVEVNGGRVEGPWNMESPPIAGPLVTAEGALVEFSDGRLARWTARLRPQLLEDGTPEAQAAREALEKAERSVSVPQMAVLRNAADQTRTLRPSGCDWEVEVSGDYVHARNAQDGERSFSIKLAEPAKDWSYVAWEAPNASRPEGRLWISDERGLRAYEP